MATLAFNVQADVDKVIQLSAEIARLEKELASISKNGSPEMVAKLESQLSSCRAEMKQTVGAAAELGSKIEESVRSMDFTTVEAQVNALTYAITTNERELASTAQAMKQLQVEGQKAFSSGDEEGVKAITQQLEVQVQRWEELQRQTKGFEQALQQLTEGGIDTSLEGLHAVMLQIGDACRQQENEIEQLQKEYQQLNKQLVLNVQQGTEEHKNILERKQEIEGEIEARRQLVAEFGEYGEQIEMSVQKMTQERTEMQRVNEQHTSLRTQIRALKEQMADMRVNGIDEQSAAYKRLAEELGRLQDIQGDIQRQGSILANDERTFAGVTSGLQGVTSGFLAAQGAAALFGVENENLQKILLKVHALMSITNALQQVSAMLNKDSAFSLVTLTKAREWWNKLLDIGRNKQIAETVAVQADTQAQKGNAAALGANAAAQNVQNASAVAGTAANITLAGAFRMVGAAIKSIPVFGWIAAALTALVAVIAKFVKRANEAKKAAEEFYKTLAENAYKPIASIMELQTRWNALADSLDEKKRFLDDNRKAFEALGVSIRNVADAENLLSDPKKVQAFIKAQVQKAKAQVYTQQAQEKTKDLTDKEAKREETQNRISTLEYQQQQAQLGNQDFTAQQAVELNKARKQCAELNGEITKLEKDIQESFNKAIGEETQGANMLVQAGINTTTKAVAGSASEIRKKIQEMQEDLDNNYVVGTKEYNALQREIEAYQKLLNKDKGTSQAVKNTQKEADDRERITKDLNKKLLDLQKENEQARIALIEDDLQKQMELIEFSYNQQIDKIRELAREMAEANKKAGVVGATETVNIAGVQASGLTQDQRDEIDRATQLSAQSREKAEQEVYDKQKDAMWAFLKEYGTYEQQRLAITEEYAKKIEEASNVYEKIRLNNERDAQLHELEITFYDGTDWEKVFGSLDTHTDAYLRRMQDKLREMLNDKSLTAEQAEALGARLVEIQTLLVERSSSWADYFGVSNDRMKVSEEISLRLAELEERRTQNLEKQAEKEAELNNLQKQIQQYSDEVGVSISIDDIDNLDELMSKVSLSDANEEEKQNIQDMVVAYGQLKSQANQLKNEERDLDKTIAGTEDEAKHLNEGFNAMIEKLNRFGAITSKVADALNELSELTDVLGLSDTGFGQSVNGLTQSATYATQAFDAFTSGNPVGAITGVVGAVKSLGQTIFSWFGGGDSDKNLARDIERLTASNNDLANAIEGLSGEISSNTTSLAEAQMAYEKSMEDIAQMEANTQEMMERSAHAYSNGFLGIGGHKSSNTKVNDAMSATDWARVSEAAGASVKNASDFWNLTSEQMYNVSIYATDLYTKIKQYADDGYKDAAQYMDDYIEYWKELEEVTNTYYEKLTSTSFDNVADSFKSAVSDMSHTAADFADDFENMMKEAVINSLMVSKYNQQLEDWYGAFANAMESNSELTSQEQQELKDDYMRIVEDARNKIEAIYKTMGWSENGYAQQGSAGGWETISEDTGEELNGRFTALQETGLELLIESREQGNTLVNIYDISTQIQQTMSESYLELQAIDDNTRDTVTQLVTIAKYIKSVKENTDRL